MHVMGGGDVGGAKTQIMNTVTGLSRTNDVMLISFRAGPFADEARERGIDVRVIERHNPFRAARTMRDLVDEFKPDIIHCHGWMTALAPLYIKKAYKDEPSFRDAKVVFSLYDNDFKEPFHPDFASKLLLKGISKKDVADLKEPVDYTALCKLAVDYSDGVIQQSEHVNEEVIAYARQIGKPVLGYQSPEIFADACNDFYDQVWGAE